MKFFGEVSDPKDLTTKEYVDDKDKELEGIEDKVNSILSNNPTIYNEALEVTEDHAVYDNCVFNAPVKVTGMFVCFNNCLFHRPLTIGLMGISDGEENSRAGRGAMINNCVFDHEWWGGAGIHDHAVSIYTTAFDTNMVNFHIKQCQRSGIFYASYGGNFSNFTINNCNQYGMRIHAGGAQIQNGKIFMCGRVGFTFDTGGLWVAPYTEECVHTTENYEEYNKEWNTYEYIPELCISNLSVQQCHGFGIKLQRVYDSYIQAVLLSQNADILKNGRKYKDEIINTDPYPEHEDGTSGDGVFDRPVHEFRQYGMQLIDCKNVSGTIVGRSCHKHWWGADLGYYDEIPSPNNINVIWDSVYWDYDSNMYTGAWRPFAKFLPEVHAETVNGMKIGSQYTEKNFTNTDPLTSEVQEIRLVGDPELNGVGNKIINLVTANGDPTSDKGVFRVYVEAPGFNIYTYVRVVGIVDSSTAEIYDQTDNTSHGHAKNLHRYYASGQNSVYSGTVYYDAGFSDAVTSIKRIELHIVFNRVGELPEGTSITPKVRVQHYCY